MKKGLSKRKGKKQGMQMKTEPKEVAACKECFRTNETI